MKRFRRTISALIAAALALSVFGCGVKEPAPVSGAQAEVNAALEKLDDEQFTLAQLGGTDSLGRSVAATVGQNGKYVGLFYFVANGYHNEGKIFDISRLLEQYPDRTIYTSPVTAIPTGVSAPYYDASISPVVLPHYWGEPLYGYYRSEDPWVLRKHLELFAYAGIDFLYLDYTNNIIYPEATKALLDAILDMQAEGYSAPQVTFLFSATDPGGVSYIMGDVVKTYFSDDTYDSCWFRADEETNPSQKPLLIGNWSNCKEIYEDRFWLKPIQWPGQQFNADAIPWMDYNIPQKNHNGVMNVSVAQGGAASSEAYFNEGASYAARGWTADAPLAHGTEYGNVMSGTNFAFQWENALAAKDDLKMVTVTGWNEWIVRKLAPDDPASSVTDRAMFVDSFNMEYSRDAEMMKGGYGDNYYMQMVENIRAFKGIAVENSDNVALFDRVSIDVNDISCWERVARKYLDLGVATAARNFESVDPSLVYKDDTARNDIDYLKIANDAEYLYVAITCKEKVTERESGDAGWMNVYLSCGGAGWEGYDFIVGRSFAGDKASVSALSADGTASPAGEAYFAAAGNTVVYAIPLSVLGAEQYAAIGVKAADNLQDMCDADEFYTHGDCAPMGRLHYAYKIA